MLVNCASVEQMQLCGLKTIKDQMKLKKVFAVVCHGGNADSTFAVPSSCATPTFNSSDTWYFKRHKKVDIVRNKEPYTRGKEIILHEVTEVRIA